jgi:alkylated DNA nucleotide flippase Atl1
MSVTNLFLKVAKGEPMRSQPYIELQREVGIIGNMYQGNYSPRQILITRQETIAKYNLQPGALRENIVVSGFPVDDLQSGQLVRIGTAEIRITFGCEPCGFVEKLQPGLLRQIEGERGVLSIVYRGGAIKLGDSIDYVAGKAFPAVPYKIIDRFAWLVAQIPEGKVLSYKQIIEGLGLWVSVYRALPAFIRRLDSEKYPVHRIVNSAGELLPQVELQLEKLTAEGVIVTDSKLDLEKYSWDTAGLYLREIHELDSNWL